MLRWNLGLLAVMARACFTNTVGLLLAMSQQSDLFDRRKHSTTLNTKLLVQIALCVRTERRVTLEQEVNSVHTIPGGNISELKRELSTLEDALFCHSKKTVGKRISDSKSEFGFYKR